MNNDITILSCPICNNPKLREYGYGIYQCDVCETYFDKNENIVLTEQEWLQTADTEQLAEILWERINGAFNSGYACCLLKRDKDYIGRYKKFVKWLKQPHNNEVKK